MPQAARAGAEVLVVQDGADRETERVVARHAAQLVSLDPPRGLNAARNLGVRTAQADLIVFLDDDVRAPPGWLSALLAGAHRASTYGVLGGPIRAELEGGGPRACGREPPPITTLDLGPADCDAQYVWGANMAVRRATFQAVGTFDEALAGRGDEEEWERRYAAGGGRVRYIAQAGIVHRRDRSDARLTRLCRAAYALGRTARRNDVRKQRAPGLGSELRILAGCGWHTLRRLCAYGIVMGAHSAGRVVELLSEPSA